MQAKETARIQSGGKMMKNKSGKVTSKKMSGKSNKGSGGKEMVATLNSKY
jgi:hypothetical protein